MPKRTSARSQPASDVVRQFPDEKSLGHIHHGDCIAGMNGLPEGSIDLVFADPPFNIGYDYDVYHDAKDYGEYLDWSRQWIGAVHRVLKPDGTFWLAIGDEYAAELKIESQKLGFHIRSWVIWYYTFGVNCKTKFSRSHAHLFHFVKDAKRFTFRAEEGENRIPSARLLVYADRRGNPDGRLPDDTWIIRPEDSTEQFSPEDTWALRPQDLSGHFSSEEENWYFPRVAGTFKERAGFHGCQMPEQLLGRIIRFCSNNEEIVLDPFTGSATTLAVAKKLNRRFVGFELSPDYVERGTERLASIRVGDMLDGAPEPTMSAPVSKELQSEQKGGKGKKAISALETVFRSNWKLRNKLSEQEYIEGIINAFQDVSKGHSVDRVIADPELDFELAEKCRKLGMPGDIRWWNYQLFRLRKAGKLSHIPTEHRTEFSWEECDAFLFASEIAWRQLLGEDHRSLDDILCDPTLAAEFDRIAMGLAPGFSPLQYRWGALKLRKESKRTKARAGLLQKRPASFVEPFLDPIPVMTKWLGRAPDQAGVYLVVDDEENQALYAGETLNLRSRLTRQFERVPLRSFWRKQAAEMSIRYFTADADISLLLAYQSLCVRKRRPEFNLPDPTLR